MWELIMAFSFIHTEHLLQSVPLWLFTVYWKPFWLQDLKTASPYLQFEQVYVN